MTPTDRKRTLFFFSHPHHDLLSGVSVVSDSYYPAFTFSLSFFDIRPLFFWGTIGGASLTFFVGPENRQQISSSSSSSFFSRRSGESLGRRIFRRHVLSLLNCCLRDKRKPRTHKNTKVFCAYFFFFFSGKRLNAVVTRMPPREKK